MSHLRKPNRVRQSNEKQHEIYLNQRLCTQQQVIDLSCNCINKKHTLLRQSDSDIDLKKLVKGKPSAALPSAAKESPKIPKVLPSDTEFGKLSSKEEIPEVSKGNTREVIKTFK